MKPNNACLWCYGTKVLIDVVISMDKERVFVIPCRCSPPPEENP